MSGRHVAEIWPSRAAVREELSRRARQQAGAGGLLLCPPFYTFDTLLPELLAQAPLPNGKKPFLPLTGPMLVQGLLRSSDQEVYSGLAAGRRLPERLWRLLVEVKAAGLSSDDLASLGSGERSRLKALAKLLESYQQALQQKGLADQADQLAALEEMLARDEKPVLLNGWKKLICRRVLWMRTLDIRLVRALGNHIEDVRVRFALTPGWGGQASLHRLIDATARALLESPKPKYLSLEWQDLRSAGGPLKDLMAAHLDPSLPYEGQGEDRVVFITAAGRYGLAEELVLRALDSIKAGTPPHEVALVFPDLDVYGPMVADVARRLGLPIDINNGMPLRRAPLVQAILSLLELPLVHYERRALADVWASPYLREPLISMCLGQGDELPKDVGYLLKRSGYLDSRDVAVEDWLDRAAAREEAQEGGNKRRAGEYRTLARACTALKAKLSNITQHNVIIGYYGGVISLVRELGPATPNPADLQRPVGSCLPAEAIQVRDHTAKSQFLWTIQEFVRAAEQAGADQKLTPGRLLTLLREVLTQTKLSQNDGAALGVSVHRLGDTMGIKPRVVLVGSLNQGEFPIRPKGQNLLSSADRLSLGKRAKRPVWRTDDEEYEGQLLQLAWLLANCSERAVLGAAGADLSGRQQAPSVIIEGLAQQLGRDLPTPSGGVFGELPMLDSAREIKALWGRLAADLLRTDQSDASLAQAALWHLCQRAEYSQSWQKIANRGQEEERRNRLNRLSLDLRASEGNVFSGRLTSSQAMALLEIVLAHPEFRELSPSALETYAVCPLTWFFSYLLKLKAISEPGWALEAKSEGDWVHRALAGFFNPEEFDPSWNPAAQEERLLQCLEKAKTDLSEGLAAPPPVWEARQDVLHTALAQVVAREMQAMTEVLPVAVEEDIGGNASEFTIPVDDGPPLSLKGRLDRLDRGPESAVVSDYKHTGNEAGLREATNREQAGVTQFQLPVYMAAANELMGVEGNALTGRLVPTLLASSKVRQLIYGANDSFFSKDPSAREQLAAQGQPNLYNAIADLWQRLASGMFVALPDQQACQYCDYRLACRAQAPSVDAETKAQA